MLHKSNIFEIVLLRVIVPLLSLTKNKYSEISELQTFWAKEVRIKDIEPMSDKLFLMLKTKFR